MRDTLLGARIEHFTLTAAQEALNEASAWQLSTGATSNQCLDPP